MNKNKIILLFFLFESFLFINAFGQNTFEEKRLNGNNFEEAAFRLWLPENTKTIRGIIVLVPGSNQDGRNMVNDSSWQKLAIQHDFALLGCCFKDRLHTNMAIEKYVDVKKGSGKALLEILQSFSKTSRHPELELAPLVLWGTSAGGEFNYEFACWKPERVLAFVVNKGGIYYSALAPSASWEVPGIFFIGLDDSPFRNNIVKGIFSINRRFGAKWILIEEQGTSHEFVKSKEFALLYFDMIIPLRISAEEIDSSYILKRLPSEGYIGVNSTREILSNPDKSQTEITSWFPDQTIAKEWLRYTE